MNDLIWERAKNIRLLMLDVDGVLTDGRLYFNNTGEEMKAFCTLDGHGIKMLQASGVQTGIITGRKSELVKRRAGDLGIKILLQGREDKWQALQELLADRQLFPEPPGHEQIAFMGDDWPDLAVMTRVGLALTVANAHRSVAERAHWQSNLRGGEGAVREACDLILKAQNNFDRALSYYLPDSAPAG